MKLMREQIAPGAVAAVLFDFDGTISTLRCGWESVMRPLMLEYLRKMENPQAVVDAYIDESTGIQTIHQMKWLAEHAAPGSPEDPWWYKDEYNRRLMEMVQGRRDALLDGSADPETYLISGSIRFLKILRKKGVKLYVASGTDHPDVIREAQALGVAQYFEEIAGAPVRAENCSKETVLRNLISAHGLSGAQVAVIGDGKVEIALGKDAGARTLGLATDEQARRGVNPVKQDRLIRAGADAIAGDFEDLDAILAFLGLA